MKKIKSILPLLIAGFLFHGIGKSQEISIGSKRLTPAEIKILTFTGGGAGSSNMTAIETRILKGDPTKPGLYTIQLTVPANTTIQAHDHPDDRIATVVSGTWFIGYGDVFDEKKLKALVPGSFYTEPPGIVHFARTGSEPVIVQITGYGPTGTKYMNSQAQKNRRSTESKKISSKTNIKRSAK